MKRFTIMMLILLIALLFSCERGALSKSGQTPAKLPEKKMKAVIVGYTSWKGVDGWEHKVKLLDEGVVGHVRLVRVYEIGDTVFVANSQIKY